MEKNVRWELGHAGITYLDPGPPVRPCQIVLGKATANAVKDFFQRSGRQTFLTESHRRSRLKAETLIITVRTEVWCSGRVQCDFQFMLESTPPPPKPNLPLPFPGGSGMILFSRITASIPDSSLHHTWDNHIIR